MAAVAVGLRVWGLNQLGYNTDEAVYAGQAAAIARDPILKDIFPIFRAHPLLFQFLLALVFSFGVSDLAGRLLAVAIGLATVYLVYRVGKMLYGVKAGLLAGLFFALMPYHVVVSRQVLLDGPLVFCTTLDPLFPGALCDDGTSCLDLSDRRGHGLDLSCQGDRDHSAGRDLCLPGALARNPCAVSSILVIFN